MPKVKLSVSVDDAHLGRFAEVVGSCERAGLEVEEAMDAIGVITGAIDADKVDGLRRVPGVADVEEERRYRIAPPDSDVQ